MTQAIALGIDVGGSSLKAAPTDVRRGALVADRLQVPLPRPAEPEAVAATVADIVEHFGWSGPVGCALPSVIKNGVAHTAAHIDPQWIGTNGQELLERRTGCRVALLNDADAAGMAEMRFGAGQGESGLVIMLTLGTGIGSALFIDGHLLPNTELGHLVIDGKDAEDGASGRARVEEDLSWACWAARLNRYLCYLETLLCPDLFILGGGISQQADEFLPLLTVQTRVVAAEMRNDAGVVGAALAASRWAGGDFDPPLRP